MIKFFAFLLLLFSITFFLGCSDNVDKSLVKNQNIALKTTDNKIVTLKKTLNGFSYDNKTLLLAFFTTSCMPCNAQIPNLNNLQNRYQNNLNVISLILDNSSLDDVQNFIFQNGVNFAVTFDKNNFKLSNALGNITSVPYMVIYDKDGAYVTDYTGAVPEEMIEADLKRIF
ncbi:MAG: TlpA family protein disulfide reductase [Campylobacteraceae bacterium]|nr:TlpA family protein disulfide reductase [Campylobacteraceae bacterium]